jgi:predicted nucleic acid-binding protein
MRYVPKLFIETTVFNFYFEGKQGQKQKDAVRLFKDIAKGKYEAYTSEAVMDELRDASRQKYEKMEGLSQRYITGIVSLTVEARYLADKYIAKGIIPAKFEDDALHIATAAVNNFDFVVSYNQGHIVKPKTMIGAGFTNLHEGYRQIGLCSPTEVIEYDR